ALEAVRGAEDGTRGAALLCEPDGHAVAVEVAGAVDFELDFDFPVCGCEGEAGEEVAFLGGAVGG
ncbi:MAG: hypothetical protein Q9222_007922, partial [Ikaeria aurantiellina]